MDNDKEAFITRLREALERAQQETAQLSLSIPSPIRDRFFSLIMEELTRDDTHRAEHCEGCRAYALQMALSALGWEDRNALRPASPKERMEALLEQVTIALRFLDKLHEDDFMSTFQISKEDSS